MNKAEYVENNHDDLTVINAARVSFDKQSYFTTAPDMKVVSHDLFDKWVEYVTVPHGGSAECHPVLEFGDFRLLHYLASHGHWTPFSHARFTFQSESRILNSHPTEPTIRTGLVFHSDLTKVRHSFYGWVQLLQAGYVNHHVAQHIIDQLCESMPASCAAYGIGRVYHRMGDAYLVHDSKETDPDFIDVTMRETTPIFNVRQRFKHQVGFTYNEVSRRYVDDTPEFYEPDVWRMRPDASIKQGSGNDINGSHNEILKGSLKEWHQQAKEYYEALLAFDVAPEQARMVLPQSMLTSYHVTGSLTAWGRAWKQRSDGHAQKEIRDMAQDWGTSLEPLHANVWRSVIA